MSVDTVSSAVEEEAQGDSVLPVASKAADELSPRAIDEAKQTISAEVLSILAERFNGKLSEVRPVDEKDILF